MALVAPVALILSVIALVALVDTGSLARGPTFQGVLGLVNYFLALTHLYTVQMVHMLLCLIPR